MKVKYIIDYGWYDLTIGKTYDIIDENYYCYKIINNNGNNHWYWKTNL